MKVSYNWLKEFIDLSLSPEEIAEKLTLIGLEVEEIESFGSSLDGVVVGEVLEVRPHPNADKLQICDVNLGDTQTQIVCGAKNVAAGQKVPVATVGSTLPIKLENGHFLKIKKAKLRGEVSEGMICSEDELGLGSDSSGIMVLDSDLKAGTPINEVLDLYQDTIIDIAITPNRPDATCHIGVARDLAAALNLEWTPRHPQADATPLKEGNGDLRSQESSDGFKITIQNPEKCHRYVGLMVKNVEVKESPKWLQNKLKAIGSRPVNNVVDVTNFVMYELGQPLHAFDYDNIKNKEIVVRDFDNPVEFETLDHVKRTCAPGTLFICDGDDPVAIAGVMGGVNSEVSESTKNILIESAYFDPGTVRRTAKAQTLQTDASYRFERGIDPNLQAVAAIRAAELIAQVSGGEISEKYADVHPTKTEPLQLTLRMSYLNRLLGTDFDVDTTLNILNGLELKVLDKNDQKIEFEIPTFRPDLEREVDLIEEVGRLYDYNNIPSPTHGIHVSSESIGSWEKLNEKTRSAALQLGFREIYTNSLISEKEASHYGEMDEMIGTLNPLNKDMSTLRPTLLHGFLKSASYNFNRRAKSVRFFEIGHIFSASENGSYYSGIKEEVHVLFGLSGLKQAEHWSGAMEEYSFFDLKAVIHQFFDQLHILDHLASKASSSDVLEYYWKDSKIGSISVVDKTHKDAYELDQKAFAAEVSISAIHAMLNEIPEPKFSAIPKFPAFEFDFAIVVKLDTSAGELMDAIKAKAGKQLESIDIFDVFEGESIGTGNKSLAFKLNFIDPNKTLNIKEVEPIIQRIIKHLEKNYSAKLRS